MNSVPLSAFLGQVKSVLQSTFSKGVWVTAEVLSISGGAHRYLELVEYDDGRREVAKAKGVIWKSSVGMLDAFSKATGSALQADMKVLVRVSPKFHESFGFSLVIEEIDHGYSLGQMELRIQAIRAFLREKGVAEANRKLKSPEDFFRLAVISPADAAGLGDFRTESDQLSALGICQFDFFHASFQGETAGDQIVDAMAQVVSAHKELAYDAMVIIRGGGAKADLYQLNHKRLCHAVCRSPLPVIIGIGHERDKLLLDDLANLRLATPSLVIAHIRQKIIENANAAHDAFQALDRAAESVLVEAQERSDRTYEQILTAAERVAEHASQAQARLMDSLLAKAEQRTQEAEQIAARGFERLLDLGDRLVDQAQAGTGHLKGQLMTSAEVQLDQAQALAKQLMTQIMAANPLAILAQGYGYVRRVDGSYLTRSADAQSDQSISITLQDGTFSAVISCPQESRL